MGQFKDGRHHRAMYINNRIWLLAWYGGKQTRRTRPDYIAEAIMSLLKKDGLLDDTGKLKPKHKKHLKELVKSNPPDKRNQQDMLDSIW